MGAFSYTTGPCHVCGKTLTAAGFARVAHEDMHVRNGDLIYVHKWSWKGIKLRGKLILPRDLALWESQDYFSSFDRCKEVLDSRPVAP